MNFNLDTRLLNAYDFKGIYYIVYDRLEVQTKLINATFLFEIWEGREKAERTKGKTRKQTWISRRRGLSFVYMPNMKLRKKILKCYNIITAAHSRDSQFSVTSQKGRNVRASILSKY